MKTTSQLVFVDLCFIAGSREYLGLHIVDINPLNAELNPICHLLALLRAHHILLISRVRVKVNGEVEEIRKETVVFSVCIFPGSCRDLLAIFLESSGIDSALV